MTNPICDNETMQAVQNGDVDQLGVLFEKHHKHLYNFFLRQNGSQQVSEDLVQEVFFRILKYKHTYRSESKFSTWMFSIAHNVQKDQYRKKSHHESTVEADEHLVSPEPNPEEMTERKNSQSILRKAMDMLSEEKKETLLLSRFENMKYEEIARVMGCKPGTVKARVHWAIKDLSKIYQELTNEMSL